MSTRALVGHYTDDGSWRAVWVHVDGAPEDLGAHLARAVELYGGDPRPVLAHVFSTKGWWSWPDDPHHPADPDDVIFTPENVYDDFHWLYLFAVPERRLDVVSAGEDLEPKRQVHFGDLGKPDVALGVSDLTLADLKPVADAWQRRCPEPLASALDALLDELHVGVGDIGLGVDAAGDPVGRQLRVGARVVHLEALGHEARQEFCYGGTALPFPQPHVWFEARPALWQSLCDALGMHLELVQGDELVHFRRVVERVADPRLEIALAQAKEIDEDFAVGDDFGKIVTRAHMVWRWLFDQAWEASQGHART